MPDRKRVALLYDVAFETAEQVMKVVDVPREARASVFFCIYVEVRKGLLEFSRLDTAGLRRLRPSKN